LVRRSPPRGSATSWSAGCERRPGFPGRVAFLRLSPRFRVLPSITLQPLITVAITLPRFLAPSASSIRWKPPFPGLPRPGHVAPAHLPCALTPSSSIRLPGVFQPGSLMGFLPSALDSSEIVLASRHDFPSCDWLLPAPLARPSENDLARPPARRPRKDSAASLQGFVPSDGWGRRRWISPLATASLALLGFFLPEALSSRASDLDDSPPCLPLPKEYPVQRKSRPPLTRLPLHTRRWSDSGPLTTAALLSGT
jgi:hypothetical protein